MEKEIGMGIGIDKIGGLGRKIGAIDERRD